LEQFLKCLWRGNEPKDCASNDDDKKQSELRSLEQRVLESVQSLLRDLSNKFNTSVVEDENILKSFQASLRSSSQSRWHLKLFFHVYTCIHMYPTFITFFPLNSSSESRSLEHKIIAVRYRIARKNHLLKICAIYKTECVIIRSPTSPTAVELSMSGDSETAPIISMSGNDTASTKHLFGAAEAVIKPVAASASLEDRIESFNQWFASSSPSHSKLTAKRHPLFRISTVASSRIEPEEVYLGYLNKRLRFFK